MQPKIERWVQIYLNFPDSAAEDGILPMITEIIAGFNVLHS